MTFRRRTGLLVAVSAAVILLFAFTYPIWLTWLADFLVKSDQPFPADAIVVLGGDRTGNRIVKAAELAKQGYASRVIVNGVDNLYGMHECDLAIAYAVRQGYDRALFLPMHGHPLSTVAEAREDIAELRREGAKKYILVTSDFHTRRAGNIFRKAAPDLQMRVVAAFNPYFRTRGWWRDREAQKMVFEEWSKTVGTALGI